MAQRPDPERLGAWRLFLEAQTTLLWRLNRELEQERNLPLTWYDVLVRLEESPRQRLRMQELVGSLLLSKSGITRLVDRMEEARLIRREVCPSDKRGAFATLTDEGRATLRQATPVHLRGIEEHFGRHIDDADLEAVTRTLRRLGDADAIRGCDVSAPGCSDSRGRLDDAPVRQWPPPACGA